MAEATRTFTSNDLARISSPSCEGCGECCRGMGDTIVLDPYDAHMLAYGLGRDFASLLNREIELHLENGVILPHLAMKGPAEACSFLGGDGRCGIHAIRPGICRLYPLARQYTDDGVRYFVLRDACAGHAMSKVRIRQYLGIPDLPEYERFKNDWFHFLSDAETAAQTAKDDQTRKELGLFLLETFFLRPYDGDFYELVRRRMKRARHFLME